MTLGDSRLGESKLGVPVAPETLPAPAETPRDRADDVVKSAFPTDENTTWDKFLNLITAEYEEEYAQIREIETQRYIETATGEPLEKLGRLFGVDRQHNETDTHLRHRIKLQLSKHTTGATLNEIIEDSTLVLQCEASQIEVRETHDLEAARFDVFIREQVLQDAPVNVDEYIDLIQEVKPAGVRAVATIGKQFTHRSEYEFNNDINDEARAYTDEDGTIDGGEYADLITARHRSAEDFDEEPAPLKPDYDAYGQGRYGESIYGE